MRMLLSAYACEPHRGSEPGVGWHWALELAKLGHDVWVLTRANNQEVIEEELAKSPRIVNLHFMYYDLPEWARRLKRVGGGIYPYYLAWQIGAYKVAKKLHAEKNCDLVHHVTFGVIRQPSFMGKLGIPFIFGPLGGGERAPYPLREGYPLRGKMLDAIRDVLNLLVKVDPLMSFTFRSASVIYVKTPDSRNTIPVRYLDKTKVQSEIGINEVALTNAQRVRDQKDRTRILYVGRFIYWKGMHLGLAAFSEALLKVPNLRLTMVGRGPEEQQWRDIAEKQGIGHAIDWIPWVNQCDLRSIYLTHDALLFPSLHDSSGNVVLEAMAHGLPIVCLNLGGPGVIVDETCGRVVDTSGMSESETSQALGDSLVELASNREVHSGLAKGALLRSREFKWDRVVNRLVRSVFPVISADSG